MCGIAGFNLSPEERVDAVTLTKALLLAIEERGRHATGTAYFEDGSPYVQKADMTAGDFVEFIDMPTSTTNAILHTRWASQGSPKDNRNNHPIDVGGILGVHNGVLYNDDEIFADIGPEHRIAEVDSEAIFALLLHGPGKPAHALERIEGSAAVAWLECYGDPDSMYVSRVSSSPLNYAFTEAGSFLFASTASAIRAGAEEAGLTIASGPHALGEEVLLRVRNGQIVSRTRFASADRPKTLSATERMALNLD